ncbi:COPII coat assembly protein SEC16-like [Rhinolophus ferrumequinum]|uniref:COPII coat assembly protein SEC16-like n=1 Tax=Rhinolophus ferrumequinum TaxID=59479 RepID=UPI00140FC571|nr:COPII coat assembly protein SEC16-like [Rhinolophus ferrumequinum]
MSYIGSRASVTSPPARAWPWTSGPPGVGSPVPPSRGRITHQRRRSAPPHATSPKSLPRRCASLPPPPGRGWGGVCVGGPGPREAGPRPSRDYISQGATLVAAAAAAGAATSPGSGARDFHSCVRQAEPESRPEAELGI